MMSGFLQPTTWQSIGRYGVRAYSTGQNQTTEVNARLPTGATSIHLTKETHTMKIRMRYYDMLDGRYRSSAHVGFNYVSSTKGNRYVRVKAKKEHREYLANKARR